MPLITALQRQRQTHSVSSRPACPPYQAPGQSRLHRETLSRRRSGSGRWIVLGSQDSKGHSSRANRAPNQPINRSRQIAPSTISPRHLCRLSPLPTQFQTRSAFPRLASLGTRAAHSAWPMASIYETRGACRLRLLATTRGRSSAIEHSSWAPPS